MTTGVHSVASYKK